MKRRVLRWIWPGRIPRGAVTMLDGDPGSGKSLVAADLCVRVAGGYAMPDGVAWDGVGKGEAVLYVGLDESNELAVLPRLDAAGGDRHGNVFHWPVGEGLSMPMDKLKVTATVSAVRASLIIVDTLVRTADGNLKLEVYQDAARVLGAWEAVAVETGAAIVLINHRTKAPASEGMARGYGSLGGIAGIARSMLGVSRDYGAGPRDGHRFYLEAVKASYSVLAERLAYRIVAASVPAFDDDGTEGLAVTARVDWLPDVVPVTAGAARHREREAGVAREDGIARGVIGSGFDGTADELDDALAQAGISTSRVSIVRKRVAYAERVAGKRNARRWLGRAESDAMPGAHVARVAGLGGDEVDAIGEDVDELGPMAYDVVPNGVARGTW